MSTTSSYGQMGAGMEASHPYELIDIHVLYNFLSQPRQLIGSQYSNTQTAIPMYSPLPVSIIQTYLKTLYEIVVQLYSQSPSSLYYPSSYTPYDYRNKQYVYPYYNYMPWSFSSNEMKTQYNLPSSYTIPPAFLQY
jgi:hypothetical protein